MVDIRLDRILTVCATAALIGCVVVLWSGTAAGQFSPGGFSGQQLEMSNNRPQQTTRSHLPQFTPQSGPLVFQVNITGNRSRSAVKIRSYIKTRSDRPFDPEVVQSDVRRLMSTGMFHDVRTYSRQEPAGVEVTFEVVERPMIQYIKFVGNQKIRDRTLQRECGLNEGESLNQYAVKEARRKIEKYYREKGFPKVNVELIEGDRRQDQGAVFMINEGQMQRILNTQFEGNEVVMGSRLKTQIKSKPGILRILRGRLDHAAVQEDIVKLTDYYRALGYFQARVDREIVPVGDSGKWVKILFVIDEGPRYVVRNVSFIGNKKFTTESLAEQMNVAPGEFFDRKKLNRAVASLRNAYGSHGHIFADIKAEPRFFEEPGQLDLVFRVREGDVVRAGDINVRIRGENPHTKLSVARVRVDIRPGEIIDIRKVKASESRLKRSQLFENDPTRGSPPRIVVQPPEEALR